MIEQPTETQLITTHDPASDRYDLLRELTNQSWNLELIVSGAALYATLSLPDLLDSTLMYYRYNIMPDTDYFHDILPIQVIGLAKGVCYVLFLAFLANFVMRAFWVGLVGLLAVYPDGIRYEQIHSLSQYAKEQYARKMGPLPAYIIRLDRRCNVVFALAFVLALFLLSIAFMYGLTVILITLIQLALPPDAYMTFQRVGGPVTLGFFALYMVAMIFLNLPKNRNNPRLAPLSFKLTHYIALMYMGLYRPTAYILFTFYSQIRKKDLQRRRLVFGLFLLVVMMLSMILEITQMTGLSSALDSRSFITLRASSRTADANAFDNLRPADEPINKASIQADVIREPYVRLFIAYPKALDAELTKRFMEPTWPDTLKKEEKRERQSAWYLQAFSRYFQLYLNDSLYSQPDYLFTQRRDNNQRGLTTLLLGNNLKLGKNILKLTAPDSANKPKTYYQIPFWYVPER